MNKLTIVKADDWEGLFVNGKLVDEGETLFDGYHPLEYCKDIFQRYGVDSEVKVGHVSSDYYDSYLTVNGTLPENLSEVRLEDE